jgi:hypothetical protein
LNILWVAYPEFNVEVRLIDPAFDVFYLDAQTAPLAERWSRKGKPPVAGTRRCP